jgi:hypothetical protein
MQSLTTQPATRLNLLEGNIFTSDWVYYQGQHPTAWAVEFDKYTYINSDVSTGGTDLVKYSSVFLDEPSFWGPHILAC